MKPVQLLSVGLFFIWPFVTPTTQNNPNSPPTHCTTKTLSLTADQQSILDLTNAVRLDEDLDELEINEYLCELATEHSQNMAKGWISFSHDGFKDRARDIWDELGGSLVGENCAYNWSDGADAVDQWMNSTHHRENMLEPSYTLMGVGIAQSDDGTVYYTQLFLEE